MIVVGVTGSFGTGKTTVAEIFAELGAHLIDADRIAHRLIQPNTDAWRQIVAYFGEDILTCDGSIDRMKLAEMVFGKGDSLARLCSIIHPIVIERIRKYLSSIGKDSPDAVVVIDAPLLIEAKLLEIVDRLVVVKAEPDKQISRAVLRTGLTEAQIRQRIEAQLPIEEKERLADYVIDNDGALENTKKQVKEIWGKVK